METEEYTANYFAELLARSRHYNNVKRKRCQREMLKGKRINPEQQHGKIPGKNHK